MGALLDAIYGAQYKPTESAYGIGAAGVVDALPYLSNPYASTSKNAAYTLGGTLLAGILASQARRETDTNNANLFRTALSMRSMTPEALESAVTSQPRLSAFGSALLEQQQLQELENVKAARQNELEIEKAKAIAGINQQGKLQELAVTNPFAYKQALKSGLISQDGAIQAAPSIITNQVENQATGQELAATLQELGGAKPSRYEQLMNEYSGNETIVKSILDDERRLEREKQQAEIAQKETLRKEADTYLSSQQPLLDQSYGSLQDLKNALTNAKETGDAFGVEDLFRSGKLQLERLTGDEEAKKRIAARSDLSSLSTIAASEIKKLMKDPQMAGKEFEKYLGAVPGLDKTPEANLEIVNRMERAYGVASQKQEFVNKAVTEGLTLAESLKAYDNFNKALPPFKNGEINPLRDNLDFNSIDTKQFLSGVPELKPEAKAQAEQISLQGTPQQPNAEEAKALIENIRREQFGDPLQKGNALAQAVDSAMLGKSKYVFAPLDTAYEEAKDLIGLGEGRSISENLSASVDRLGQGLQAGEKAYPQSSTGAQLVGALVSPANKLYGGAKAVTTLGKVANIGKKAALTAGIAGVQAAGESDITSAAKTGALISGGLDVLGGVVGKAAKIAPSVLNKAYGIFKSDYNSVAKKFSAKNLDKIKSSVDDGLNLIKKEAGISTKEAFKSNEDFYTDMFSKSEELIAKRTNFVDQMIEDIGEVAGKQKISTSQIVKNLSIRPEQKEEVVKKINEVVKAINKNKPDGFNLSDINALKRQYNPLYKYNPVTSEDVAYKGIIDHLRGRVENTIEKLIPKKVDKSYAGVLTKLNSEIKDLINVQNIYAKKIPGARADDVLSDLRQKLYTTGGAGTQGARNLGEVIAGDIGGKVGTAAAVITSGNRFLRPATQSFIKNQEAIKKGLDSQGLRTAMTSGGSSSQQDYAQMFSDKPTSSNIPYDQMFNTRSSLQATQANTAPQQQSVSRQQSQSSNNSAVKMPASQNINEIKAFTKQLPPLIQAVIQTESAFNPQAVSKAGAKGLMQVMPFHYERLGVTDPFDPMQSIKAGATILQEEIDRFQSMPLALAAYNAGAPTVLRAIEQAGSRDFSKVKKFLPAETAAYVPKVINNMSKIKGV